MSRLLDIDEVAAKLGLKKQTLYRWRSEGRDMPQAVKIGSRVRWREGAVDAWIDAQSAGLAVAA